MYGKTIEYAHRGALASKRDASNPPPSPYPPGGTDICRAAWLTQVSAEFVRDKCRSLLCTCEA
jgi:hypothetical protein